MFLVRGTINISCILLIITFGGYIVCILEGECYTEMVYIMHITPSWGEITIFLFN